MLAKQGLLPQVSDVFGPTEDAPDWQARLSDLNGPKEEAVANAPTEARARLLAVLRALLHEAEQ